ncbi:MAG: NHL repeat-containing protein, partial [Vulcanimicrobiaceae bacterium]
MNVTLAGIPKTLTITALPSPSLVGNSTSGFQFASAINQTLVVDAIDADGNVMMGPGAPVLAASATSVGTGSGIAVTPVVGNPNEFTVSSTGFGTATFSTSATPTSPLAGAALNATAALSATTITTTLAGKLNTSGSANGTGTAASFYNPTGIAYDPSTGDLYVTDTANYTIRQVTTAGVVTTLAGTGISGFANGTGVSAAFSSNPIGSIVYAASTSVLYVGDSNNCAIRQMTTSGVVTTILGVPPTPACGYLDGNTSTALVYLTAMTFDSSNGNLYSADRYNCA